MSAFSLSDLLNPEPQSHPVSSAPGTTMDLDPPSSVAPDLFAPDLFHTDTDVNNTIETLSIFEQQGMVPMEQSSSPEIMRKDSLSVPLLPELSTSVPLEEDADAQSAKNRRHRDPTKLKDTKHSSKNEGTHTDRRYLCYICNKLFTRRRSVRDHLVKIHAEKTWEPQRSLEVIVEPHSGEPIEPIEDIIARGVQTLPPKQGKVLKPRRDSVMDEQGAQSMRSTSQKSDENQVDTTDLMKISSIAESALAEIQPGFLHPSTSDMDLDSIEQVNQRHSSGQVRETSLDMSALKTESSQPEFQSSMETSQPVPAPSKKRPYPASTKKGTAKAKTPTPHKRPKLSESDRSTPVRSPSVTPAQRFGSKLKQSVFPASPSSVASSRGASASPSPSAASPASSNEDGEVFCTCRRGDNHSWMIACDGTCDDWYHGKCVGIRERDGDLIDKYICPMCTRDGFVTTWKRMCRRKDCRKPARVLNNPPSKYCSQDCALKFMTSLIARSDPTVDISRDGMHVLPETKQKRYRKKIQTKTRSQPTQQSGTDTPAYSDPEDAQSDYETDTSVDEVSLPTLGGSLRAGEIKSLLNQCRNIETLRELGARPPTPPAGDDTGLQFDSYQKTRLADIEEQISAITKRLDTWALREKVLELIFARSKSITDSVKAGSSKKKPCGYDRRCAWDEHQFNAWLKSSGKESLESSKIGPPEGDDAMSEDEDLPLEERNALVKGGVCVKNNCTKHLNWQKSQVAEVRFEQDRLKEKIGRLERERRGIRERACVRGWEVLPSVELKP